MPPRNGTSNAEIRLERKIPNGKLLKCRSTIENGRISGIKFFGDFFLHPEESIEEMEKELLGKERDEGRATILDLLNRPGVEMAGISPDDFADMFSEVFDMAGSGE